MHSTPVYGLELLILEGAEEKASATDHRESLLVLFTFFLISLLTRTEINIVRWR